MTSSVIILCYSAAGQGCCLLLNGNGCDRFDNPWIPPAAVAPRHPPTLDSTQRYMRHESWTHGMAAAAALATETECKNS